MNDLPPNIFGEKYQIQQQIANKGNRQTFLATNIEKDTLVVIKLLLFGHDFSWDDLKLFEREAETLKSLSHPAIPRYLEHFEIDTEAIKGFALVQSYIEAPSLASQIESGRTFTEAEVKQIAKEILEILNYLHSRQPTVIHRDIKPSNILITNRSGNNVGKIYLIDFGSVQNLATKKTGTITVVGTYGYMPPEQFGGRAKPTSDLYSLGATVIYLVTGQHPAELPETDLKIEFEKFCNLSPGFINWLQKITNPSVNSRLTSAKKALEELENCDNYQKATRSETNNTTINKPFDSKILLNSNSEYLEIVIPSRGFFSYISFCYLLVISALGLFIPKILIFYIDAYDGINVGYAVVIYELSYSFSFILIFVIFLICMIIGEMICIFRFCLSVFGLMKLRIDRKHIFLVYEVFDFAYNIVKPSLTKNIYSIEKYQTTENYQIYSDFKPNLYLKILTNKRTYTVSSDPQFPLTELETHWIAQEIGNWLNLPVIDNNETTKELNTNMVKIHQVNASLSFQSNNYQDAIEHSSRAIELNSKAYKSYYLRGLSKWKLRQNIPNAIKDIETAREIAAKHQDKEFEFNAIATLTEIKQQNN